MRSFFLALVGLGLIASEGNAQGPAVTAPSRPFIVIANQRSGVATLVELATGRVSSIELGLKPHEVAVSPDARIAALTVPSEGFRNSSTKVVVLDLGTAKVLRTIELQGYRNPHGIAFLSDSVALVGTLAGTSAVYVNVRNGRVLRAIDGLPANPYVVKLTATGRAYVSSPTSSKVSEIDIASGRVLRTIHIPDDPAGIAVSADGKELYAAVWKDKVGGGITIYDLEKGSIAAKLPAIQPRRISITADGRHVVVSDEGFVRIVDRATRQVRSVPTGSNAGGSGVACAPDSTRCYVPLSGTGDIVEVDVVNARVLRRFPSPRGADGIAYVPR